ncbi:nucleotide-binding universal stress UspA family protein [Sphaerotilus hippei]|uniref:Nucleotide-binding universal stress UspA family protein n=1 Tax=Sphaerotilus hippei TaxID=744406 RepID=A0A318H6M8_9BURK|nr:universal stress protein [Sphaerotilus hippei]PXW99535.1 nucleotide-binding universal stress UspA family protein [Sphaerotilus hippei]
MFKHLLVPVDGSELSLRAMDSSIELARQLGARITAFVAEPDVPLAAVSSNPTTFVKQVEAHQAKSDAHARNVLGAFEERAKAAGITFVGETLTTVAVDNAIVETAERCDCDLILMVTHGRGAFGELLFGSHTKNVMSRTKRAVLVLH